MKRKLFATCVVCAALLVFASVLWAKADMPLEAKKHLVLGIKAIESAQSPDDFDRAVKEFENAARLAPDSSDIHYYLGRTLSLVQGQTGRAIKEFEKYLDLAPNAPDAQKVRGEISKLEELKNMSRKSGSFGFLPAVLPDGVYVKYVYPGPLANLYGIKRGDKIIAVNGIETAGMSLKEFLNHMDGEPGSYVELDIIRAGKQEHRRIKRPVRKWMKGFRELGEEYFDDIITKTTKPVIVVFWAPWCKYCQRLGRMMSRIGLMGDRAYFWSISADMHPDLAERFDIRGLPTTLFFKNSQSVGRYEGSNPQQFASEVMGFIKRYRTYQGEPKSKIKRTDTGHLEQSGTLRPLAKRQSGSVGMVVRPMSDGFHVMGVRPSSPAARAGIMRGDIIIEVDKQDVRGLSLRKFGEMIDGPPGTDVLLRLRNGAENRFAVIKRDSP